MSSAGCSVMAVSFPGTVYSRWKIISKMCFRYFLRSLPEAQAEANPSFFRVGIQTDVLFVACFGSPIECPLIPEQLFYTQGLVMSSYKGCSSSSDFKS